MKYYIVIDLGGTNIAAGIVDKTGKIIAKDSVPTLNTRPIEAIMLDMTKLCKTLQAVYDKNNFMVLYILRNSTAYYILSCIYSVLASTKFARFQDYY